MYSYHYEFEDSGRGLSPDFGTIKSDKELRTFLNSVFDWMPKPIRERQIKDVKLDLDELGHFEARMENLSEELMEEGDVSWDDIESVDTDASIMIRRETKTNPDTAAAKRRAMRG